MEGGKIETFSGADYKIYYFQKYLSVALSVCDSHISRTVHPIGFKLAMCIVKGQRRRSVELVANWTHDTFNIKINS